MLLWWRVTIYCCFGNEESERSVKKSMDAEAHFDNRSYDLVTLRSVSLILLREQYCQLNSTTFAGLPARVPLTSSSKNHRFLYHNSQHGETDPTQPIKQAIENRKASLLVLPAAVNHSPRLH